MAPLTCTLHVINIIHQPATCSIIIIVHGIELGVPL